MSFERKELANGIYFNTVHETKFKANLISIRFVVPLSADTAAKNALLFPVLLRGSEHYPDIGKFAARRNRSTTPVSPTACIKEAISKFSSFA